MMKKNYFKTVVILFTFVTAMCKTSLAQVIITLGAGTVVTSNTTASPINQYYRSLHCQMVYTAAELKAATLCIGTINKLGFYINSGVTNALPNYTIKMKHTTAADASSYDGAALMTVYNVASYNPVAGGFDMLTLNTPFSWNGTDNILIDVCFDQVSAFTSTGTIRTYSSAVTNGFIYERNDSSPQCGVACAQSSTDKPQIRFDVSNVPAIDLGVATFLKPLMSKGCFGTDTIIASLKNFGTTTMDFSATPAVLNVNVTGANPTSFTLSINSGTLGSCAVTDYTLSTTYSMFNAGVSNFKGYTTVAGDAFAADDTTYAVITKSLTPFPNLGNDTIYCNSSAVLYSNTSANNYLWNTNSTLPNLNITTSGKYWVRATNTNGCKNADTIFVSVGSYPVFTLGPDTSFCQGSGIILYAGSGIGNTYSWSNGLTTPSISVGFIGTYSVLVTDPAGCQSSDNVTVTSRPKPSVSLIFGGVTSFCASDNLLRPLTEGSPSNGNYIGAGVITNTTGSYFNPSQANQGSHIIIYNYNSPNGCSNTAKDTLKVNACVGIEELTNNINLLVGPNPTTGMFVLEINTDSSIDGKFTISSIDGKLVYEDVISGDKAITKSIDITSLANGIYYLKLETKDSINTFKVLKH